MVGATLRPADEPAYAGLDAWRVSGDVSALLLPDGSGAWVGQVVGSTPIRAWRDGDGWTVRRDDTVWTLEPVAPERFETVRVEDLLGNVTTIDWADGRPDRVALGGFDPDGDGVLDEPPTSEVRFFWETTEPWVSTADGAVRAFDHRLTELVVTTPTEDLVVPSPLAAWVLTYEDQEGAVVLGEVSREGRSDAATPAEIVARFTYTKPGGSYDEASPFLTPFAESEAATLGDGITRTCTTRDLVDLDGDSLSDRVWVDAAGWTVEPAVGHGFGAAIGIDGPDATMSESWTDIGPSDCGDGFFTTQRARTLLTRLDPDPWPDLLVISAISGPYGLRVHYGTGVGFAGWHPSERHATQPEDSQFIGGPVGGRPADRRLTAHFGVGFEALAPSSGGANGAPPRPNPDDRRAKAHVRRPVAGGGTKAAKRSTSSNAVNVGDVVTRTRED